MSNPTQEEQEAVIKVLLQKTSKQLRAFFRPQGDDYDAARIDYFGRFYFPGFYKYIDAEYHGDIREALVELQSLSIEELSIFGARGTAKTALVKIWVAYATIYNLFEYGIIFSADIKQAKQFTTDVYNMLTRTSIKQDFGEIFSKKEREKTKKTQQMGEWITSQKKPVKLVAVSALQERRGAGEAEARADLFIGDDYESVNTLQSLLRTEKIWENREGMVSGLADGRRKVINLANYLATYGNVEKSIQDAETNPLHDLMMIPVAYEDNKGNQVIQWPDRYVATIEEMKKINKTRDKQRRVQALELLARKKTYKSEYLCQPRKHGDVMFDEEMLAKISELGEPLRKSAAGLHIFEEPIPGMEYFAGIDTAEGTGGDSNTMVICRWDGEKIRIVATAASNRVRTMKFAEYVVSWGTFYNDALLVVELNNTGHAVVGHVVANYDESRIYKMIDGTKDGNQEGTTFGFRTTSKSKTRMVGETEDFAWSEGFIIPDERIIKEMANYTAQDRVSTKAITATRHFDLFTGLMLAVQGREFDRYVEPVFA